MQPSRLGGVFCPKSKTRIKVSRSIQPHLLLLLLNAFSCILYYVSHGHCCFKADPGWWLTYSDVDTWFVLSYFHFIFFSPFWCDRNRRSAEWHRQQRWQPIVSGLLRIQNLGQPRPKIAHQFSAETFQSWQREYSVELPASGTSDQSIDGTNSQYQPTINSYP